MTRFQDVRVTIDDLPCEACGEHTFRPDMTPSATEGSPVELVCTNCGEVLTHAAPDERAYQRREVAR